MIDYAIAREIVLNYLSDYDYEGDSLVVMDNFTIEKNYGWVFFYNSKKFLETNDFRYALAGNGPIVIEKIDGSVHELGTACPFEETIKHYEQARLPIS